MKSYPSISTQVDFSQSYWVFDKLDGSNIRAEWTPKRGFYKFGSRTQLLTPDQVALWPAVERIASLGDRLGPALSRLKTERVVCFFEWHGPNSFAGSHTDPLDAMDVALLDVSVYKRGFMAPADVLDLAAQCAITTPTLLHQGRVDQDLLDKVRAGTLPGVSYEGIIGKVAQKKASDMPVMFKHKSQQWLRRLKEICGDDQALFDRLR